MAKGFAGKPLDTVPLNRFADALPGNGGIAILGWLGIVRANPRHQRTIRVRFSLRARRPNLCLFTQPQSTFHRGAISRQPSTVSFGQSPRRSIADG